MKPNSCRINYRMNYRAFMKLWLLVVSNAVGLVDDRAVEDPRKREKNENNLLVILASDKCSSVESRP